MLLCVLAFNNLLIPFKLGSLLSKKYFFLHQMHFLEASHLLRLPSAGGM
jgi:hypothetical protein